MSAKTKLRCVALLLLLPATLPTATAGAHYDHSTYTFRDRTGSTAETYGACSGPASDPVNFLQFGPQLINVAYAQEHVRHHTPWDGHNSPGAQAVQNHGVCYDQRGSDGWSPSGAPIRHTRYFQHGQTYHVTDAGNYVWFQGAHIEHWACSINHAVYRSYQNRSGFDYAASRLADSFISGRHQRSRITYDRQAARRTFQQCNGAVVPWDGRVHHFESR